MGVCGVQGIMEFTFFCPTECSPSLPYSMQEMLVCHYLAPNAEQARHRHWEGNSCGGVAEQYDYSSTIFVCVSH